MPLLLPLGQPLASVLADFDDDVDVDDDERGIDGMLNPPNCAHACDAINVDAANAQAMEPVRTVDRLLPICIAVALPNQIERLVVPRRRYQPGIAQRVIFVKQVILITKTAIATQTILPKAKRPPEGDLLEGWWSLAGSNR